MAGKGVEFLTPVGRLVQGDCFEGQTKDQQGNPYLVKNGPNKGQPMTKYFVAVAFKKGDPAWLAFKKQMEDTARRDFPALFPNPVGPCVNPNFAMKIIDGDGVDQTGRQNSTKEGFAGHEMVRFSSQFAPKCFAVGKYQPHEQLTVQNGINPIPRGHHVRVAGTMKGNDDAMKPGLYVSHTMVEWSAIGDVITSGPDAASVFGGGAAPAAGGLVPVPGAAYTIEQCRSGGWTDDQIVAAGYATRAVAAGAPPPLASAGSAAPPPPAQTAVAAPPPTGKRMLPAAGATTYDAYIAAGWNDAMLIQNGFMAA